MGRSWHEKKSQGEHWHRKGGYKRYGADRLREADDDEIEIRPSWENPHLGEYDDEG